jgi:hypothetical protein
MKLGGERLEAPESVSKCLQCQNEWSAVLERCGGPFITPQENLAVGVSETRTCPAQGRTCPANLSGTRLGHRICPIWDLVAEELG